ncbi:MAG: NAD(P)-dependent oxidoreductase [Alphaproteobacteria bacterium]|nr:NAD(P)-dependent oxidoreductase [Alphaproteobacteria bacterium]
MQKIFVTGGASYLGGRIIGRLCAAGSDVHALVRPSTNRGRLPQVSRGLSIHEHDGSTDSLVSIMERIRPDAVIHLAGKYVRNHAAADIADLVRDNILLGAQLLEGMRAADVRKIIHASSFFQNFDSSGYRPFNLYAATKQAFEDVLLYYSDAEDMTAVTLVLFDTYGPGDWRPRLVQAMIEAYRTGKSMPVPADDPVLDLVHADDVADAFLLALDLIAHAPEKVRGGRFAVTSGRHLKLSEIISTFEKVIGRPLPRTPGQWPVALRRISEPWSGPVLPGWSARISLEDGFRSTLERGEP